MRCDLGRSDYLCSNCRNNYNCIPNICQFKKRNDTCNCLLKATSIECYFCRVCKFLQHKSFFLFFPSLGTFPKNIASGFHQLPILLEQVISLISIQNNWDQNLQVFFVCFFFWERDAEKIDYKSYDNIVLSRIRD